jgi:hypothetical protein
MDTTKQDPWEDNRLGFRSFADVGGHGEQRGVTM